MFPNVGIELPMCEGNRHVFSFKPRAVLKLPKQYACPKICA